MVDLQNNVFMIPGPVKIHPRVLQAMAVPVMGHRTKDFRKIHKELRELLQYLFKTQNDVALFSGSGTAGLDAVMGSLLDKGEKAVVVVNGKFGERLYELAEFYAQGIPAKADYGRAVDLSELKDLVEREKPKVVALCHNETSTGFTNPAEKIAKIAKDSGALFVLDGITSVGGIPVETDKWEVDAVIFGSQKCVAAPAGLAGVAVSEEAKKHLHDHRSYYLHLRKHLDKYREANDTPYTPAIPLFLAMLEALRMIKEEGLENRIAHTRALAEATRAAVKALDLELLPEKGYESNTVTAIRYPEGIDDAKFRSIMWNKHGVLVAGGQSVVKGKIFRIGHMGVCTFTDLLATFGAVEATFMELGYPVEKGASTGAVAERMKDA